MEHTTRRKTPRTPRFIRTTPPGQRHAVRPLQVAEPIGHADVVLVAAVCGCVGGAGDVCGCDAAVEEVACSVLGVGGEDE